MENEHKFNPGTRNRYRIFNENCITGCNKHIKNGEIDLIITDPPYGISGDQLHKHYNRDESNVIDGYVEIDEDDYLDFSHEWIQEASRILRPNGQMYIVSGYTNLYDILDAIRCTDLIEINHIIWKYNFGVYTKHKYISSHYHILYLEKTGQGIRTFNPQASMELEGNGLKKTKIKSDEMDDVWVINKEFKRGKKKNKNELPVALIYKMILTSSNEDDLVCDMFMGGFSTARVAIGLNRRFTGFEVSKSIYDEGIKKIEGVELGDLL